MAVLFYQSDATVVEQRQRAGATGMANDFANDLDPVLLAQPVAYDVEHGAFEDFLRFQQLSWQTLVLSRPRYSIMRSFKRARRPDFYLSPDQDLAGLPMAYNWMGNRRGRGGTQRGLHNLFAPLRVPLRPLR
jgi:hypothetical protein